MRRAPISSKALLAALCLAACSRSEPAARPLDVLRTSPVLGVDAEPLLLNDAITVYFTEPIQPLSVTPESVQIVDDRGERVPGVLRVDANWISFQPEVPLARDLGDGSFRPGASYRLLLAGSPRPDALRSVDGRRLHAGRNYELRVAGLDHRVPGFPAPLRPPASELPFLLRETDGPQPLPVDVPRLRLHFTLPVLPTSVSADAFVVLLAPGNERIRPRSARVVRSRLDTFDGCTVELDLGSSPSLENGNETVALKPDVLISVQLATNSSLTDYAGNQSLPWRPQFWSVVEGSTITLAEWPDVSETEFVEEDRVAPGFEVRADTIRPRVRVEAGDGSLGVFRPLVDTVLRPGVPFDRGDGQRVVDTGGVFSFLAVEIREGVTVVVDNGSAPVRILACGGMRIAGALEVSGATGPLPVRRFGTTAVSELLANSSMALLAAGDVYVEGAIRARGQPGGEGSPLTLAAAGRLHVVGSLPYNTLLAFEEGPTRRITGTTGQVVVVPAVFTYGLPEGAAFTVHGVTPWRRLPLDRDAGVVRLPGLGEGLQVGWQSASPDPRQPASPALHGLSRPQRVFDRDVVSLSPGGFLRFDLEAKVAATSLPSVHDLRLVDR